MSGLIEFNFRLELETTLTYMDARFALFYCHEVETYGIVKIDGFAELPCNITLKANDKRAQWGNGCLLYAIREYFGAIRTYTINYRMNNDIGM